MVNEYTSDYIQSFSVLYSPVGTVKMFAKITVVVLDTVDDIIRLDYYKELVENILKHNIEITETYHPAISYIQHL